MALIDLSIGKGVKTIGKQVFEHSDIQTLKTPVAAINHLYNKYHLKQVEIVGGGTIPSQAFVNCENLTKVTMSDQITGIDVWAFYDCSSLNDITFSKNISSIGEGAFWHCSKLTNVILGENIMSIGARAFADCPNLLFGEHNNVNYLGTKNNPYLYLIGAKDSNITSCEIHPYTIIIAEDAFSRCSSLKELVLPSGLAVIGELSFDDCTALKTVSYRGTASEWYAISKKQDCFSKTQVTQVQCSDQTIDI